MIKTVLNDKDFVRSMLSIAIPVSVQSLIQASLSMIDQFMIGQLGEASIASVGLGSKLSFILLLTLGGVTSAASIYTAQFWGKKDTSKIGQVLGSTLSFGMIITIIFTLLSFLRPHSVISIFTEDTQVVNLGASYMRIVTIGYIPMLLVLAYSSILRSTENAKLPMYAGLLSVGINTFLNYLFIFGNFGFPKLGVDGAAVATTISRTIECIVIIMIVYLKKYPGSVHIKELFKMPKGFTKMFFLTSLPLLINESLWAVGDAAFSVIYGRMGTNELAAMTITYPVQILCIGFFFGLGSATGVMLGKQLGADNLDKAYQYAKRFIFLGITGSLILGLLIMSLSVFYVSAYNISVDVQGYAIKILIAFGFILWIKVSNMIVAGGILRSGGETKIVLYLELLGIWCVGVPLGFLAAFVFDLPIHWVYLIIATEELVRLIFGLKVTFSKKWMKNITEKIELNTI